MEISPHLMRDFASWFHTIYDAALALVGVMIVRFVSQPGRRHHLGWAYPTALAMLLTAAYRAVVDYHFWFAPTGKLSRPLVAQVFLYASDVIGIYGGWMLWRLLHELPPVWIRPNRVRGQLGRGRRKGRGRRRPARRG